MQTAPPSGGAVCFFVAPKSRNSKGISPFAPVAPDNVRKNDRGGEPPLACPRTKPTYVALQHIRFLKVQRRQVHSCGKKHFRFSRGALTGFLRDRSLKRRLRRATPGGMSADETDACAYSFLKFKSGRCIPAAKGTFVLAAER